MLADLRRKLTEIAGASPGERIAAVTIRLGPLAHLTEPALRLRWPDLSRDPPYSGAALRVETGDPETAPAAAEVRLASVTLVRDAGRAAEG